MENLIINQRRSAYNKAKKGWINEAKRILKAGKVSYREVEEVGRQNYG